MKRANGAGSVHQDKNTGKWIARLRAVDPKTGNVRQIGKRVRGTEVEAHQALEELRELAANRTAERARTRASYTVGDMLDDWYAAKVDGWAPNTAERHAIRLGKFGPVRAVLAERVEADDLEALFEKLARSGTSRDDLRRMRSAFVAAYDRALKRKQAPDRRNPGSLAELPDKRDHRPAQITRRESRALTAAEVDAMCEAATTHRLGAIVPVLFYLGLRPAEARALQWDDIDLEERTLTVAQSMSTDDDGRPAPGELKTEGSFRVLRLPSVVADALAAHKANQDEERALGVWPGEWAEFVFLSEAGTPVRPENLRRLFRLIGDRAGVVDVYPEDGRDTATTRLVEEFELPLHQVADHHGHADLRMIERHYRKRVSPVVDAAAAYDR